jgi:hypothetical protein
MTPRTVLLTLSLLGAMPLLAAAQDARPAEAPAPAAAPAAAESRDYASLPVCKLSADGKRLAVEPCRTAPARVPMPRRPVPQIVQRMPLVKQAPQVAMPAMPPSQPLPTLLNPPNAPAALNGCGPTGCNDAAGAHLNTGPGTVILPSGKTCSRNGAVVQC